jgi:predicted MFS family arabinose efflux permease
MRTLALTILLFNVTYGAAWSVLVLYAGQRLGMDEVGFGLLTAAIAVGGILGTVSYGTLERRFKPSNLMRVGLTIETLTHLILALTIRLVPGPSGAAWSVLELYAGQRLGMDEVGFGLMTAAIAVGGILGTVSYGTLERRFKPSNLMRVGLTIETLTHLILALTTSAPIALTTLVVFGAHAFVWGTLSTVVRQRAVPDALMGRVGSVYRIAIMGGIVIGTPIGGLLARRFGITAPFWFGFFGSALLVILLWREFEKIVHAGDTPPDEEPASGVATGAPAV